MAEVVVTNTAIKILEDLILDRWRSAAHRIDDFAAGEGQVSFIEVLLRALIDYGGYPEELISRPVEPDWWLRNGSGLALHLATTDVSTLSPPGFVQEIANQGTINLLVPTISSGRIAIDITDINLRPSDGIGSISLDWEDGPPSLVMRISFESEGSEVTGFREIDWEQMEVLIRLVPRIEAGRLFWSPEVEVDFSPQPSRYAAKLIAESVQSVIRSLLMSQLEELATEIGAYLMALPLRPMPDRNGEITLSALGPLEFLELLGQQGTNLPERWGNFTENFVNACLLPNNPLRAIELDGLDYLLWPARLTDHYALHINPPRYQPAHGGSASAMVFDVEPIQVAGEEIHDYHEAGYEARVVERENYQVILDHVVLMPSAFYEVEGIVPGPVNWTIAWTVEVRHPNLAWPEWVTIRSKEARLRSRSPVFDLGDRGESIDWLETGGEVRIAGEVRALGRVIASFNLSHLVTGEVPIGSCVILEQVGSTVTARARLARLTSIDRRQLSWIKLVLRQLYLQINREFLFQYLGSPPPGSGDEWLTEQALTRLHVAAYLNDQLLSLTSATSFNIVPRAGFATGYGYEFPEAHSTFHIHHNAADADARFTLKVALCVLEADNSLTEAAAVEQEIRRRDPGYPDAEWRIPCGESSTQLLLGEEADLVRVSIGLQNELFDLDDVPVEYRPKPYDITITNVHGYWDFSIGKGEMEFFYRIWSETAGQPSDRQLEGKLGFVEADAPFDWNPVDYRFRVEAPVGSIVHIRLRGREWGARLHSMGSEDISFEISAGDREDGEHTSTSDLFDFRALVSTASPPPMPLFEPDGAGADMRLEILPTESWSFRYAVSWADSLELVYSPDPDRPSEEWESVQVLYRETSEGAEGDLIGDYTVEGAGGQRRGFYQILGRNIVGSTPSNTLELVVED